jgi:RNA polymerase sigma-70 factor (ECF subfamily)
MKALNFDSVYSENFEFVTLFVRAKVKNPEVVEELVQDTFVRVAKHLHTFDQSMATLRTWLCTIAKNIMTDHFRKEKVDHVADHTHVSDYTDDNGAESFQLVGFDSADSMMINAELREKIDSCMDKLKPHYKGVAEMYFKEGRKYEEIVKILNVPMGTVKTLIRRSKAQLQEMLQDEYRAM